MKRIPCIIISFLLLSPLAKVYSQKFPEISESKRISMLEAPEGPVRMVLDTDTYNEIDDQFAVVYSLLSKEKLVVEALYAAPFHNNRSEGPEDGMEKSYEEILRLLDRLDVEPEGFVFKGSRHYLDPEKPEESPAALDLVKRAKTASPDNPLYVVPVGAITNVANAILLDPSIIENIVVVWLGGNSLEWPTSREFNFSQDIPASRLIFDCGVPLVQMPCVPVVTHLATTLPEMETHLKGQGAIGDYLLEIYREFSDDHYAHSKVLWDMTAVAWLVNAEWTPTKLIHAPIVSDQHTFSVDETRHMMRAAFFINRDGIFRDFFKKIEKNAE
ncbi:MAG: nucleoside hydrolase [Bacteroidetes bacterium]|nr:nucleoside hydrolase [Bacteroidota bacterium]